MAALTSLTKAPAHVTGVRGMQFRAAFDVTPVRVLRSTYETPPRYTMLLGINVQMDGKMQ